MKILKNTIPLHKLYGFLLLNTSLIVCTPLLMDLFRGGNFSVLPIMVILTLPLCGITFSVLLILRKRVAIRLLTGLLVATILVFTVYMIIVLPLVFGTYEETILVLNVGGFFIAEAILGLLILHSKKLADEFENYS